MIHNRRTHCPRYKRVTSPLLHCIGISAHTRILTYTKFRVIFIVTVVARVV